MEQVALLQMPWGVPDRGTLSLGLLKKILEKENIPAKVYYLNLRFAKRMKPEQYEFISYGLYHIGDWLFSQALYDRLPVEERVGALIEGLSASGRGYDYLIRQLRSIKNDLEAIMRWIPEYIEECLDTIAWENMRIAGFTCKVGSQLSSLLLARRIKERVPGVKTVFGGPNVFDSMGQEIISGFDWVDYVVDGECEQTVGQLFRNILQGNCYQSVPGVWMRRGDQVLSGGPAGLTENLDSLPIPDYTEYFEELKECGLENKFSKTVIPYESSRGCWWGEKTTCTFCGVNNGRPKYRTKSPEKVLEEIVYQTDRYRVKNLYAADCIMNMDFFNHLIPRLAAMGLGLDIYHDIKPCLNGKQLSLLHKMGISTVLAGIESLDDELLALMRKGTTALQNIQLLKLCRETGLCVYWSLLFGIPGEDPARYRDIVRLIPLISHLEPPGDIVRICLDRYSPYFYDPERFGIRQIRPAVLYEYIYPDKRINLNRLAYTFEFEYENSETNIKQYVRLLNDTVMKWKKLYSENKTRCEYTIEGDAIRLVDARPGIFQENAVRNYTYHGLTRDIYVYCNEIRSFEEILRHVNECGSAKYSAENVKNELDRLIDQKLMLTKNSKYIGLAVEKKTADL